MRFRKKPVVVEAERFDGTEEHAAKLGLRAIAVYEERGAPKKFFVDTLEGRMRIVAGEWLITGVKGEKYPCKPDIFEATYEPAEES